MSHYRRNEIKRNPGNNRNSTLVAALTRLPWGRIEGPTATDGDPTSTFSFRPSIAHRRRRSNFRSRSSAPPPPPPQPHFHSPKPLPIRLWGRPSQSPKVTRTLYRRRQRPLLPSALPKSHSYLFSPHPRRLLRLHYCWYTWVRGNLRNFKSCCSPRSNCREMFFAVPSGELCKHRIYFCGGFVFVFQIVPKWPRRGQGLSVNCPPVNLRLSTNNNGWV